MEPFHAQKVIYRRNGYLDDLVFISVYMDLY